MEKGVAATETVAKIRPAEDEDCAVTVHFAALGTRISKRLATLLALVALRNLTQCHCPINMKGPLRHA